VSSPSRLRERSRELALLPESGGQRLFTWRRKAATAVAGVLALVMGYGVVFGHNGLTAYQQKRQEEHRLRDQMQDLEHENAKLRGHVERLQNDPGAIEHQAREELHYTRPGEVIYTLPPTEASSTSASAK
jgi:cell division protein FtsB